ncbi:SusC/RagA family protein [Pedobacter ginsengisoli]|uniref:SusC/RagA family protein n=1 Tax=Pedobacter ginsengisoli TaxID=363852 RepID=A0A2D1U0Y2_9SPHI|nr:SusC/RagA family TonB-linked outer membrane protein [Pedobacter ginsengisoli]ATP55271.1 SusC/RagA family protein [Pedobacter ginsengisoli]
MRTEAFKNENNTPSSNPVDPNYAPDLKIWDTKSFTDWQNELIGRTANYDHIDLSASGGTSNIQYLISTTYHKQTSVFPSDFDDSRVSLHFNINSISTNKKLKIQLSGNYLIDNNLLPQTDITVTALLLAPNAPSLYNDDRSLNWMPNSIGNSTWTNPLSVFELTYSNKTRNLIGNSVVSYKILKNIEFKTNLGYTDLQTNEYFGTPLTTFKPERRSISTRTASYTNSIFTSWIVEPQLNFEQFIAQGKLNILIGATFQENTSDGQRLQGRGYSSDQTLEDIKSASDISIGSTLSTKYRYNAYFSRFSYNWQDKYLINLVARRDGSSRFGKENLFHNFGSIGLGWVLSNEESLKKGSAIISFLKLRTSYGITGNDQIGEYQTLSLFKPNNLPNPYQQTTGLTIDNLPNPYLQWEVTRKMNFGLDLGLIKDRILVNANYFINRSSNQLLPFTLPVMTGFGSITSNFPAKVQNSGWEISLNTINFNRKKFNWSSNLNFTAVRNKLLSFPNIENTSYGFLYQVGQPLSITKLYKYAGVNQQTGTYQIYDREGNVTSEPDNLKDKVVVLNTAPKFDGGFLNSFKYKDFELDIFLQFVKQIGPNLLFGNTTFLSPGYLATGAGAGNQPTTVLDRWQKPGDIASVQRFSSNFSVASEFDNAKSSDAFYTDASFIRLKNVSLSWHLPHSIINKIHLRTARVYIQGQNLVTITKYKGLDPERMNLSSLPSLRVITTGIQFGL